jgi:hypothetical protein
MCHSLYDLTNQIHQGQVELFLAKRIEQGLVLDFKVSLALLYSVIQDKSLLVGIFQNSLRDQEAVLV